MNSCNRFLVQKYIDLAIKLVNIDENCDFQYFPIMRKLYLKKGVASMQIAQGFFSWEFWEKLAETYRYLHVEIKNRL